VVNTFGTNIPFAKEKTEFCVTLQFHQNGSCFQITAELPFIYTVPHATRSFSSYFYIFPFCGRCTQQALKTLRVPPCNNTAFRLCMEECEYSPFLWTVPYVHCCHQTLDDLTSTEFAVCCVDLLKIVLAGAKCCHFLQCRPEDSTFEASKTTALLLFSTVYISNKVRIFFLRDLVRFSSGEVQQWCG